jgi:hypothetical protein
MTTKMTKPKHTHPWMNTDIRRKINQKHRAHAKARKTKKKKDKDRYKRLQTLCFGCHFLEILVGSSVVQLL